MLQSRGHLTGTAAPKVERRIIASAEVYRSGLHVFESNNRNCSRTDHECNDTVSSLIGVWLAFRFESKVDLLCCVRLVADSRRIARQLLVKKSRSSHVLIGFIAGRIGIAAVVSEFVLLLIAGKSRYPPCNFRARQTLRRSRFQRVRVRLYFAHSCWRPAPTPRE